VNSPLRIRSTCIGLILLTGMVGAAGPSDARQIGKPVTTSVVHCVDSIDTLPSVAALHHPAYREILGRVALPIYPAHLALVRVSGQVLPFWSKFGLLVRTGSAPVEISVASSSAGQAGLVWDNQGDATAATNVEVDACSNTGQDDPTRRRWLGYPGGAYVRRPSCIQLIVRVGSRKARVRLDISSRSNACVAPPKSHVVITLNAIQEGPGPGV